MQRITNAVLEAKLARVNALLGFENPEYGTVGALRLYGAYGSTSVVRVVSAGGAIETLSPLGTKREAAIFLEGIITGIRFGR